jgi:hypothetical protein
MQLMIRGTFIAGRLPAPGPVLIVLALLALLPGAGFGQGHRQGLRVPLVDRPPDRHVVAFYEGYDKGGNTSVAHEDRDVYKWSGPSPFPTETWGYFTRQGQEIAYIKRDRDLGQTFTYAGKKPGRLTSITVATGYGTNAVRARTYGRAISLQVFEVSGEAVLHDNGSDSTREAFHGFPHNRPGDSIAPIRDDYLAGEVYTSLGVFSGAVFPGKTDFGFPSDTVSVPPDHPNLKGRYLQFRLPARHAIRLRPGKRYAFLILLDGRAGDGGFTLANHYAGSYPGGHGIRRDGNGAFPPVPADPTKDFTHPDNARALASAHFPDGFAARTAIPPGTNGYPDVDTWRDLRFYVQAE